MDFLKFLRESSSRSFNIKLFVTREMFTWSCLFRLLRVVTRIFFYNFVSICSTWKFFRVVFCVSCITGMLLVFCYFNLFNQCGIFKWDTWEYKHFNPTSWSHGCGDGWWTDGAGDFGGLYRFDAQTIILTSKIIDLDMMGWHRQLGVIRSQRPLTTNTPNI